MSERGKTKLLKALNIALSAAIVVLLGAIVTLIFFVSPMQVIGESMLDTLRPNDRVWVQKVGYELRQGDIIVFEHDNVPPIKRIIATPGQTVRFDAASQRWLIDGEPLDEPYLQSQLRYDASYWLDTPVDLRNALTIEGLTVGEDMLFVLGDNRNNSKDSHVYGCIAQSSVKGKRIG